MSEIDRIVATYYEIYLDGDSTVEGVLRAALEECGKIVREKCAAENAELRKDAERLDWLDRTGRDEGHGFCGLGYGEYSYYTFAGKNDKSARETIDAAIKEKS